LLFNRCTGLLLARQLLLSQSVTAADSDFIGRNIAKAQLAVGDALLVSTGSYHWSCLERRQRIRSFPLQQLKRFGLTNAAWREIQLQHEEGAKFKLHPYRSQEPLTVLKAKHTSISDLARDAWLAIEKLRLGQSFPTHLDYALAPINKCSDTNPVRNLLLNLNTFGADTLLDQRRWRYPRERLLNSLPLLLWGPETPGHPAILHHLQRTLHSKSDEWSQLVSVYKQIWPAYG
jgi:hypothetical protein